MSTLPRLAVTMGDPAGVGPELCLRLLEDPAACAVADPLLIGDAAVLKRCADQLGLKFPKQVLRGPLPAPGHGPALWDQPVFDAQDFRPGLVSAHSGRAAYHYITTAIDAALAAEVAGVVTAPINKDALHAAGISQPGHTEIFAERTASPHYAMFQYSSEVRASFVTVHCGYAEVPALLTQERILEVIELTAAACRKLMGRKPKLAVLGLNPHAGEQGLFGQREEERLIIPAIEEGRRRGHLLEGPMPPDTAFIPAKRRSTDAFICMYHDQGHIPLKALAFDCAVNVTLGLPIIRTSVDHGTACDIAWQGKADMGSLRQAFLLAAKLHQDGSPL